MSKRDEIAEIIWNSVLQKGYDAIGITDKILALWNEEKRQLIAEWFEKGRNSIMRKNQSGCVCKLDEEGENIIELCGLHADYFNALLTDKWEVVEECPNFISLNEIDSSTCGNSGAYVDYADCKNQSCSGTITRQATIEELEEILDKTIQIVLKSGGRLRRKEAEE